MQHSNALETTYYHQIAQSLKMMSSNMKATQTIHVSECQGMNLVCLYSSPSYQPLGAAYGINGTFFFVLCLPAIWLGAPGTLDGTLGISGPATKSVSNILTMHIIKPVPNPYRPGSGPKSCSQSHPTPCPVSHRKPV